MKKIAKIIRRWRRRRLYRKLFMFYAAKRRLCADNAGYEASAAFQWLTGEKWKDYV